MFQEGEAGRHSLEHGQTQRNNTLAHLRTCTNRTSNAKNDVKRNPIKVFRIV